MGRSSKKQQEEEKEEIKICVTSEQIYLEVSQ
jgi:hypothetical protein